MLIRQAEPERDGAACSEIYGPFVAESATSFEVTAPDTAEMAARIERISARYPWLVACPDEHAPAVGFAYASPHRERAAYRWAVEVSVYIDPRAHRQGLGRTLYTALFELLRRQGLRTLLAGITLPNPASVGLHESLGFQPVGIYRRIGWKAGGWWDVGWWQLELAPDRDAAGEPPPEPGPPPPLADRP